MSVLKETYKSEIAPALMKKFGYKSVMQIPKLDKIVINVGCGEARENSKVVDAIINDLQIITGQKPVICRAKKSVANFKLREGMPIGVKVTLRGDRISLTRIEMPSSLPFCRASVFNLFFTPSFRTFFFRIIQPIRGLRAKLSLFCSKPTKPAQSSRGVSTILSPCSS